MRRSSILASRRTSQTTNDQTYWAEDDETWYDCDESYYQRDPNAAQELDPGEHDEVYAAYVDARKRFNDQKLARGFYPVAAMVGGSS
eukprot:2986657-Pyramimonas_sp.AAC.1